jgi:hypothetical protein
MIATGNEPGAAAGWLGLAAAPTAPRGTAHGAFVRSPKNGVGRLSPHTPPAEHF